MEDTPTPWLIAEVISSPHVAAIWVWAGAVLGLVAVVLGAVLFSP